VATPAAQKLWELEDESLRPNAGAESAIGYALSRAAVRAMLKEGRGAIVNVAAKAAVDHAAGAAAYAAFKIRCVALLDFSRSRPERQRRFA